MKHEFRRELMSDSYDQRTRLYFDPDAVVINAATVTLLATEMTVYPPPGVAWSFEQLKAECMRVAAMLRNPAYGLAPPAPHPAHLHPYVEIVLTDRERIFAKDRLPLAAGIGLSDHTDASRAMERVNALAESANLIDFLAAKQRRASN
jgi:hypothetical protein